MRKPLRGVRICLWACLFVMLILIFPACRKRSASQTRPGQAIVLLGTSSPEGVDTLDELGMVVGAAFDPPSGKFYLIGNGEHLECSPTPQQIAVALKWAFMDSVYYNFLTIDPWPDDPQFPWMVVRLNQEAAETEFGWIMFEADRRLKGLSLGFENYLGVPFTADLDGFQNVPQYSINLTGRTQQGWSRFWFYPKSNAMRANARVCKIENASIHVDTEAMKWVNGKLIPDKQAASPAAEAFKNYFNARFEELADRDPIFRQVEQLMRLLLISEWIRKEHIPVNLDWIERTRAQHHSNPKITPAITTTYTRTSSDARGTSKQTATFFGGVNLNVEANTLPANTALREWTAAAETATAGQQPVMTVQGRRWPIKPVHGLNQRYAGAIETPLLNVPSGMGRPFVLRRRRRDFENRHYRLGKGEDLNLPALHSYYPNQCVDHNSLETESITIQGREESGVEKRTYQLYDENGSCAGNFDRYEIDQEAGKIVCQSCDPAVTWRLYPEKGVVWAVNTDGRVLGFDQQSGAILTEKSGDQYLRYHYNSRGVLEEIELEGGDAAIRFSHGNNGALINGADATSGESVKMYDPAMSVEVPYYNIDLDGAKESLVLDRATGNFSSKDVSSADYLARLGQEIAENAYRSSSTRAYARIFDNGGESVWQLGHFGFKSEIKYARVEQDLSLYQANPNTGGQFSKEVSRLMKNLEQGQEVVLQETVPANQNLIGRCMAEHSSNTIYVTTSGSRAEANIQKLHGLSGTVNNFQVELIEESLNQVPTAMNTLAKWAGKKAESDVVVVVAHTTAQLPEQLKAVAAQAQGKLIVLLNCGDPTGGIKMVDIWENLLKDNGANGVIGFDCRIKAEVANAVMEQLQTEIGKTDQDIVTRIKNAIRKACELDPDPANKMYYYEMEKTPPHVENLEGSDRILLTAGENTVEMALHLHAKPERAETDAIPVQV